MNESFWPLTFAGEIDLEGGNSIRPEDIASYAYPPGKRERYTQEGWNKAIKLGIAQMVDSSVTVDPALDWHDIGCIKRYGATSDTQCSCEIRRAERTGAEP